MAARAGQAGGVQGAAAARGRDRAAGEADDGAEGDAGGTADPDGVALALGGRRGRGLRRRQPAAAGQGHRPPHARRRLRRV